jgi:hypothetical protein
MKWTWTGKPLVWYWLRPGSHVSHFLGRARSGIVFAAGKTQVYWPHTHLSPSPLRWRTFTWSQQIPPPPQRHRLANASAHYLPSSWVIRTSGFPQWHLLANASAHYLSSSWVIRTSGFPQCIFCKLNKRRLSVFGYMDPSLWMSELKLMRIPAHMWMSVVRWRASPYHTLTCVRKFASVWVQTSRDMEPEGYAVTTWTYVIATRTETSVYEVNTPGFSQPQIRCRCELARGNDWRVNRALGPVHWNSNEKLKEKFGSCTRKIFDRSTTTDSSTWNITHNTESTAVWSLKPERWGSLLVQENYQEE